MTLLIHEVKQIPKVKTMLNSYSDSISRINKALEVAIKYGGNDGSHHKDWVIDQMVRALTGDEYDRIVAEACDGEDGPNTYSWETGIAP